MNYALVEDGKIVSTALPESGTLPDGRQVSGFDKLDPETLAEAGWLPIEDADLPDYDPETQNVNQAFEVSEGKVVSVYTVVDIPTPEPVVEPEPVASVQDQFEILTDLLVEKGVIEQAEVTEMKEVKEVKEEKEGNSHKAEV